MIRTLLLSLALACALLAQTERTKIILDTDIGTDIDDAWAVGFVAQHPGFETLAITITDQNTPARAKVACKLLARAGRTEIPVAVGRKIEQPKDGVDFQYTWAEDYTAHKPIAASAADTIVQLARKYPNQITLIAVGPLQNVADALRTDPGIANLFKRVVLMSGNIYGSAWSDKPRAEWNVVRAIQDAQLVYSAGLPLTIVPLDATTLVQLSDEERDQVRKRNSDLSNALESLYRLWLSSPKSRMTLHDQLAVAEAASPNTFCGKYERLNLSVDDSGFTKINANGKTVNVCFQPKRDEFMRYYLQTLLR